MKKGLVICGPDVAYGPLALLSGSFEEKVEKAARLGCDGVELMVRDPAMLDWPYIRRTLEAAGLAVPQVVTGELYGADGLCLVTSDQALARRSADRYKAVIDLAACLGAMVNMGRVRGRLDLLDSPENAWEIAAGRVRSVAAYAGQQGVRLTIEPLNRYETDFILNTTEGLRFCEEVGLPNLGLMLDLFHMNIEESSIEAALRLAGDRLWHVHVADSNRRYPLSGHLDFTGPLAALESMGYTGYLSGELLPLPDPDTAGQKTIEFLTRALAKG